MTRVRRVVGGDARNRPAPKRVAQRLTVVHATERWVHFHVRVERADRFVRQNEVVWRDLPRRLRTGGERMVERRHRLARGQVHEVDRSSLGRCEGEVALNHHALRR